MKSPIKILLIEDDPDDVELLQDSLDDNNVSYEMKVLNDGALVLDYMQNGSNQPDIIVLDLNLPCVHGKEILKRNKNYTFIQKCSLAHSYHFIGKRRYRIFVSTWRK